MSMFSKKWTAFVADRYRKSKKSVRFLNLSSFLSTSGIGLGVAAIIIVISVMGGFEQELRQKLMSNDLHLLITPKNSFSGFELGTVPLADLESNPVLSHLKSQKNIDIYSPVLSTEVILRSGTKVSGVVFKGLNAERVDRFKKKITEEALPQMLLDREGPEASRFPSLWIGKELAYEMGLIPGDFVTLISPTINDGPFANIPRMKRFVVEGIYTSGVPDLESQEVFAPIAQLENFLRVRGRVTQIEVTLKNPEQSLNFVSKFKGQDSTLKIQDWNELNLHLFASMKLERIAMFLILLFTVLIASLNIVSTLTLMVQEKLKEIAILKTLGANSKQISEIYLRNGLWVGGVGVGAGTVFGVAVCWFLSRFPIIQLPEVYYDRTLPVDLDGWLVLGVSASSFFIVVLASYFPARQASRLTPLDGIRAS